MEPLKTYLNKKSPIRLRRIELLTCGR